MGHVGSKTRSPGQILGKPCVRSRGHIFSRILMKVGQDVCLDDISACYSSDLVRMFVLVMSQKSLIMGNC